mgnify:CR=1 FL=1
MDKRYLASLALALLVCFAGLVYIAIYGDSFSNIANTAFVGATIIASYYFFFEEIIYKKLGWLEV